MQEEPQGAAADQRGGDAADAGERHAHPHHSQQDVRCLLHIVLSLLLIYYSKCTREGEEDWERPGPTFLKRRSQY